MVFDFHFSIKSYIQLRCTIMTRFKTGMIGGTRVCVLHTRTKGFGIEFLAYCSTKKSNITCLRMGRKKNTKKKKINKTKSVRVCRLRFVVLRSLSNSVSIRHAYCHRRPCPFVHNVSGPFNNRYTARTLTRITNAVSPSLTPHPVSSFLLRSGFIAHKSLLKLMDVLHKEPGRVYTRRAIYTSVCLH